MQSSSSCHRTFTYQDPAGQYLYFFQVVGGGLAKATTITGNTCNLPAAGYMVCYPLFWDDIV